MKSTHTDTQAIYTLLCQYCRAVDRMDRPLAESIWHSNSTANYEGFFEGSAYALLDWLWETHASFERHSHQIANTLIEINGGCATSETYVTAILWTAANPVGEQTEILSRGRYLDNWEYHDGRWAMIHRTHVVDMQSVRNLRTGYYSPSSQRGEQDPSYRFLTGNAATVTSANPGD